MARPRSEIFEMTIIGGKEEHKVIISKFMLRKKFERDRIFRWVILIAAGYTVAIIGLLLFTLAEGSLDVIAAEGLKFFIGTDWNSNPDHESYGALPYIVGTVVAAGIAMILAVPISLMIAIFLSEIASSKVGTALSFIVELLASVPSVIYGYWALFVFRLWIRDFVELPVHRLFGDSIPIFARTPFGLDIFTAGIVLAIMIIPIISSISREVIRTVPTSQREAAYSLGATRWEMIRLAILPYSKSGLLGAATLGLARAIGETVLVTMIIGNAIGFAAIPTSLFSQSQTISSVIANEFAEASGNHVSALIGLGVVLFGIAVGINLLAHFMVSKMARVASSR